jgi:hypothetical protein
MIERRKRLVELIRCRSLGEADSRVEVVELIIRLFLLVSKDSTLLLKEQLLLSFRDIYKRSLLNENYL